MRSIPPPPSRSARAGLTLVEVLVAILVLTTGALASVGTQLAIARLSASALARARDATAASAIIDSLRTIPCPSLTSGMAIAHGARVTWSVTALGDLRGLRVAVAPSPGRPWAAATLLPCV